MRCVYGEGGSPFLTRMTCEVSDVGTVYENEGKEWDSEGGPWMT